MNSFGYASPVHIFSRLGKLLLYRLGVQYTTIFSFVYSYTIPTFIQGFKRDLEETDLTETLTEHKSSRLGNKMEKAWKAEERRILKKPTKSPSLHRVLWKVFGFEFIFYGIVLALSEATRYEKQIECLSLLLLLLLLFSL